MDDSTSSQSANKKKIYIKRTTGSMTQSASRRYTTPTSSVERSPFKIGCGIGIGIICGFFIVIIGIFIILGSLGTALVVNRGGSSDDVRNATTHTMIGTIDSAIQIYKMKTGRFPKSLEDLTVGINDEEPLLKAGALNDAWAMPFEYKLDGKKYTIISAGADGTTGTADDITN